MPRLASTASPASSLGHPEQWRDEASLAATLTWIAALIALIVAIAVPGGYLWLTVQGQNAESAIEARLHAAFVTQVIGPADAAAGDWRESVSGLIETELTPSRLPEQRAIVDSAKRVVTTSGPDLESPTLIQRAPLLTPQGVVGEVVVMRSLRPVLWQTFLVALLAAGIGGAMWVSLRVLPLRALRHTLAELRRHEGQARERAEELLRIVLDNAIEGVVVFNRAGRILSTNLAAAQMLGRPAAELATLSVSQLLKPNDGHDPEDPFPIGQYDTVATRADGNELPVEMAVSEMEVAGTPQRIGILRDVTERKQNEARLSRLANYDSLTGLPNRQLFRDRLQQAMARSRRSGRPFALMFLDLDRFKIINDSLGHDVGDKLLIAVSKVLASCVREGDTVGRLSTTAPIPTSSTSSQGVYRLGGDEFTVLIEDLVGTASLSSIAQRILEAVERPFVIDVHELYISTSIGITVFVDDGTDIDGLIKQADMAMYRSKELGRDTYFFYNDELNREAVERHNLEGLLRHALDRQEFRLHFQPKASLADGRVTGVEALLRWQPSGRPLIGPDKFIPILEETGLIVPVGAWAIREACAQMVRWQADGMAPINLAVNLSARQFRQQDLIGHISKVLRETGFDPTRLEIELTESMLIVDTESVLRIMNELGNMGVRIAIDDFGTGHSSLSYLKRFDLDTLKIDRSFVRDAPDDPEDTAIATAVIALAHGLQLKVVAEGVETEAQVEFLRAQGCDEIQGYLLSRPLDANAFAAWMTARLEKPAFEPA